jgi:hypothetical protein
MNARTRKMRMIILPRTAPTILPTGGVEEED